MKFFDDVNKKQIFNKYLLLITIIICFGLKAAKSFKAYMLYRCHFLP